MIFKDLLMDRFFTPDIDGYEIHEGKVYQKIGKGKAIYVDDNTGEDITIAWNRKITQVRSDEESKRAYKAIKAFGERK